MSDNEGVSIVVVEAPAEHTRFRETLRNAGVGDRIRPGQRVSETQELLTLVFDDITYLFNNEPSNALTMLQRGPSRDRYADFGDLDRVEPWRDFSESYTRYSVGMLSEMYRKIGIDENKTVVYERHGHNYALFSVYDEPTIARRYNIEGEWMKPNEIFRG